MMDTNKQCIHKLLALTAIDAKDDIEEKYERCLLFVQNLISGKSEKEGHEELTSIVIKNAINHEEVCTGLLVAILTDPSNAQRHYRDLTYVSRDGMSYVINVLNQIVLEKYQKLHDSSRTQLIWILKEMIKNSIVGTDGLCMNLLRQISGGDISPKNIWLAETVVDIFIEYHQWLEQMPILVAYVVYTYLRLIGDHSNSLLTKLRQKEVDFCVSLLREKFVDCITIGRDLVRLLQNVARIPEFEKIWRDLLTNPTTLAPNFGGIQQLMKTRTSRRFFQSRLTPDMERKIVFLTSQVKFGQQKRYQDWFQRQYLSTPESQTLRCDVIRFICGVIHPPNELLCSDIIPRWAVIGWLLTTCTSNVAAANAKLSLFYDWFFYDAERDNIMNIEPAILVMYHSIRSHPAITATLLDFLCRIVDNFCPAFSSLVKTGVKTSLTQILEKRVLQSLSPLFDSNKLDRELRSMVRETFPDFCATSDGIQLSGIVMDGNNRDQYSMISEENNINHNSTVNINESKFSDDEEEPVAKKPRRNNNNNNNNNTNSNSNINSNIIKDVKIDSNDTKNGETVTKTLKDNSILGSNSLSKNDLMTQIEQICGEDMRSCLKRLYEEKDNESRCEAMEQLVQFVMQDEDNDQDMVSNLTIILLCILEDDLSKKVFPSNGCSVDDEELEDSIGKPLFVMFRNLCQTAEEDPNRIPLLNLLAEMGANNARIGYSMMYYLKATKSLDNRMSSYREYVRALGKDLTGCLLSDLKSCQSDDVYMFCYLIPDIYTQFANIAIGNSDLLNLIVSCIDSTQLQDLISHIMNGTLKMFRKDSLLSILNASLEWESIEQYYLWQLLTAHDIPIEQIIPILPKLEYNSHSEAMTNIMLYLQRESPTSNLIKHIFSREAKNNDYFVVSVLNYWSHNYSDKLSELISSYLTTKVSSPAKRTKRNVNNNKVQLGSNVELILAHLDCLRQRNKNLNFFNSETMQTILVQLQSIATDAQKTKYSDLLALAEELEPKPTTKRTTKNSKSKSKFLSVSNTNNDSNTDSDSSDDDIPLAKQQKTANSRKKRKPIGSDSD
ncbi:integrator complex subunit 3-like [Oppia nitens]|uniref:integrator complex subunit 3-like n=1 Tax=Oppia nitens TaxID=1686743 RepID=UPI0023DCB54D|nr:integrator complex subunit 3-like [Oppia nitens]